MLANDPKDGPAAASPPVPHSPPAHQGQQGPGRLEGLHVSPVVGHSVYQQLPPQEKSHVSQVGPQVWSAWLHVW